VPFKKIINDPIYGFISIDDPLIFKLIEHPYFQRLRRIKQLGLTDIVYPGANHSRFHHALGAMHLMSKAIATLRSKEVEITTSEAQAVLIAILLHDIGHGPFSHTLEKTLLPINHERISTLLMKEINASMNGQLEMAIAVFSNRYPKKFLHQLVSGQLDMDRLDYLTRDSFYTGVSEGIVGLERIIQMLNVEDDSLVVEEKGIYSIEKFIVARRLMYWQVYLHKTTVAADIMLVNMLKRIKERPSVLSELKIASHLKYFFSRPTEDSSVISKEDIDHFVRLDDYDIVGLIKSLTESSDDILKYLSNGLLSRRLFKIRMFKTQPAHQTIEGMKEEIRAKFAMSKDESDLQYLMGSGVLQNEAYADHGHSINILMKNGELLDIAEASDNYSISALRQQVEKYFVCTAK